ncbi:hypothetical protein AB0C15_20135 [Micromonospora sp. NPDC048835]|uniref:hypothetical protein n=1 Tax=Micromonospora sp. NPDC048835 TaxID=3155147 RepID=UPI0033F6A873
MGEVRGDEGVQGAHDGLPGDGQQEATASLRVQVTPGAGQPGGIRSYVVGGELPQQVEDLFGVVFRPGGADEDSIVEVPHHAADDTVTGWRATATSRRRPLR